MVKKDGYTLVEMILAMLITIAITSAIVSYFLYSLNVTTEIEKDGGASLNSTVVVHALQKNVERADILYLNANILYIRYTDTAGTISWSCFYFQAGTSNDGQLYHAKLSGGTWGSDRMIVDSLSSLTFELIESNFVKVIIGYKKGVRDIDRTLYVSAMNMPINRSDNATDLTPSTLYVP